MDVVYYVRPGERNEALRYSLRSLVNLPHDAVWVVGYKPSWVTGVEYLPLRTPGGPAANAIVLLSAACGVVPDDRFIVFNDDFYVMAPVDRVPMLHAGPLSERQRPEPGPLRAARAKLAELGVRDPLDWTLHVPLEVMRQSLAAILRLVDRHEWRTMYGNLAGITGERADDVKVRMSRDPIPDGPFLSSAPAMLGRLLPRLRAAFPEPCGYEA